MNREPFVDSLRAPELPAIPEDLDCCSTWRIPGTGEPGGRLSAGLHRVGHDWRDSSSSSRVDFQTNDKILMVYEQKYNQVFVIRAPYCIMIVWWWVSAPCRLQALAGCSAQVLCLNGLCFFQDLRSTWHSSLNINLWMKTRINPLITQELKNK